MSSTPTTTHKFLQVIKDQPGCTCKDVQAAGLTIGPSFINRMMRFDYIRATGHDLRPCASGKLYYFKTFEITPCGLARLADPNPRAARVVGIDRGKSAKPTRPAPRPKGPALRINAAAGLPTGGANISQAVVTMTPSTKITIIPPTLPQTFYRPEQHHHRASSAHILSRGNST